MPKCAMRNAKITSDQLPKQPFLIELYIEIGYNHKFAWFVKTLHLRRVHSYDKI